MNGKQTIVYLLAMLLLVACGEQQVISPAGPPGSVEPEAATTDDGEATPPAPAATTILADGRIEAANPALSLGFTIGGRLIELSVESGDEVAAGDLIARLDDKALLEAITNAEMQVTQAETSLAQAQLALDDLLNWEPDELAVALAEANLAAAEAGLESAEAQDAAAGFNLTPASIAITQAERALADAREAYDNAWKADREWELTVPGRKELLEREREAATRAVQQAQEGLTVARANYNLALANQGGNSALNAEASLAGARQALKQALTGPKESDIASARLQLTQAELALKQAQFNLAQARQALEDAELFAPWAGTILSVQTANGAVVGGGTPIVTLLDTGRLQFHTTNLSERDLAHVAPGLTVMVSLKSYPDRSLSGAVSHVLPQASGQVGDAATFTVVINLDSEELPLWPGMTGRAEIVRETGEG